MVGKHVKFLVSNYIYSFAAVLAICVCIVLLVLCMFLGVWSVMEEQPSGYMSSCFRMILFKGIIRHFFLLSLKSHILDL